MSKSLLTDIAASLQMFEARSLNLPPDITLEQFSDIGRFLKQCSDASQLWLQDWKAQGERILGPDAVSLTCQQLELEIGSLPALVAPEDRVASLSPEHHFVAARMCEDAFDAKNWLETAVEANLDARQLALSIKAGEVRRASPQAAGARMGVVTPHTVLLAWQHYRSAVHPSKYDGEDAEEVREVLMEVFYEIREFCAQLKK